MSRKRSSLSKFEALMVLSLTVLVQLDVCWCTPSHRSRHHADMSYEDTKNFRSSEELPRPAALNSNDDPLVVQTRKGKVKGKTMTATTGKEVDAWFGIPYAQKPLGRFNLYWSIALENSVINLSSPAHPDDYSRRELFSEIFSFFSKVFLAKVSLFLKSGRRIVR